MNSRTRMTGSVGAALLVCSLLLAGCASSTPEPSPTSTPSPTETSTPSASASPLDGWVILPDAVGPIHLNDDRATVEAAMSQFTKSANCPNPLTAMYESAEATTVWISFDSSEHVIGISLGGDLKTGVATPRTAEGIGVGSDVASVTAAYPGIEKQPGSQGNVYFVVHDDGGVWISFETADETPTSTVRLVAIFEGSLPPSEFCG